MEKIVLNDNEIALLIAIRTKFQWGEVVIMVKDGKPVYIKKAFESEVLDKSKNRD